ncbi:hypothetical protein [Occultella kanbiaonis]|uniref:hypothetical protein n=1 Tax=Occultella kanbiaonis TaxID=2675754 RepID=UPI0012B9B46E|nr:hypothetical protein [Occultella kanbiaonis]
MRGLEVALLWVTAIGTVLAAIVPGVLFFFERRGRQAAEKALTAERRDRAEAEQRRAEADLLAQVRRVAVWPTLLPFHSGMGPTTVMYLTVHVANHSDNPVFNVVPGAPTGTMDTGTPWQLVTPGEEMVATVDGADLSSPEPPRCRVEFTDVSGRRWARYSDGYVVRLNADQLATSSRAER